MRTEKELWEVVLSRPDLFDYAHGLCIWILNIWFDDIIEFEEYNIIHNVLDNAGVSYFIGPKGEIQPRIDWIKERIKQLES
jgi:hypothetical protein